LESATAHVAIETVVEGVLGYALEDVG
jgi:hypothetical protein